MQKNILILCCGYLYASDAGFGYHVWKALEKMNLPENVDLMEVGYSACMVPHVIEGKDKLIVVDTFYTKDAPGSIVRLRREEVPIKVTDGKTDTAKLYLLETLQQIELSGGKCPQAIFAGIVPVNTAEGEVLSPQIERMIPLVLEMIMEEIRAPLF